MLDSSRGCSALRAFCGKTSDRLARDGGTSRAMALASRFRAVTVHRSAVRRVLGLQMRLVHLLLLAAAVGQLAALVNADCTNPSNTGCQTWSAKFLAT